MNGTGSVVFGGIDIAKQSSTPFEVVMAPPISTGFGVPNLLNITDMAFTRGASGNTTNTSHYYFNNSDSQLALLDSGNPAWNLPQPVWDDVRAYLRLPSDADTQMGVNTPYEVECAFLQADIHDVLTVYFNGRRNAIDVQMRHLVLEMKSGKCVTFVGGEGPGLGDPFLRSVVATFDLDRLVISLAEARYTTDSDVRTL